MTWEVGKCEFYGEVCQYCGVNDRNYCNEKIAVGPFMSVSECRKIEPPPQPVGNYKVDQYLGFTLIKKPNWFHRKMVELILGWKWEEVK